MIRSQNTRSHRLIRHQTCEKQNIITEPWLVSRHAQLPLPSSDSPTIRIIPRSCSKYYTYGISERKNKEKEVTNYKPLNGSTQDNSLFEADLQGSLID